MWSSKNYLLLLGFLIFAGLNLAAQDKTIIKNSWNTPGLAYHLNDKWAIAFKPIIIRNGDFFMEHDRVFADFTIKYKLDKNWSFQLLERTVIIPDATEQIWFFIDAAYKVSSENLPFSVGNRLRMHYGTEFTDYESIADFIRYQLAIHYPLKKGFTPIFTFEPFWQFNQLNELKRIRYEGGFSWKFAKNFKFGVLYRYEEFYNLEPDRGVNTLVSSLIYTIPRPKKKDK